MAKRNRGTEKRNNQIRIGAGLGLIAAGVALFFLLQDLPEKTTPDAQSDGFSAVPVAVNYPAPALSLSTLNGNIETLADYRQNVLLVNNWAIWCPPCKAEMPALEAYYDAHASDGLMIIAIEAGAARHEVLPFVQSYGLKFQIWLDPQHASMAAFRNGNLPNSLVIDRAGMVRYAWTGAISQAMLEKFVTPLLSQNSSD